jgi:hypothetical protein
MGRTLETISSGGARRLITSLGWERVCSRRVSGLVVVLRRSRSLSEATRSGGADVDRRR